MSGENIVLRSWNVCRCCGIEKNIGGVNLCEPDSVRKNRLSEILSILPKEVIYIDAADELSKFICTDCEITLNHFSEFCEMVKKAQKTLKLQYASIKARATEPAYCDEKTVLHCHTLGTSKTKSQITLVVGNDGKIKCEVCGYLLTYTEFRALELTTYNLGTVVCVCQMCGQRGDVTSFLQNKNNSVSCTHCYSTGYKQSEERLQNAKRTKKIHECNICSKTFRCKSHCDRHKMTHSGAKPFLCETCGTGFNQKKSLKLHMLSHSGINPFECKWCGQSFRFKVSLESHIINIHSVTTDKQKIECDRCKKQFATKYKLFRHHRSHTGIRPYKCEVCNKFFSQTGNLKAHLKKHKMDDTFSKTLDPQELIESASLKSLGTIFDEHCPQRKDFLNLEQETNKDFGLNNEGSVPGKESSADLFSDFNPQEVLFSDEPETNSTVALPTFKAIYRLP